MKNDAYLFWLYFNEQSIIMSLFCLFSLQIKYNFRPDWEKCSDCVQGGIMRWKEISEGKRSDELVDLLLNEIQSGGIVDTAVAENFYGQVRMFLHIIIEVFCLNSEHQFSKEKSDKMK